MGHEIGTEQLVLNLLKLAEQVQRRSAAKAVRAAAQVVAAAMVERTPVQAGTNLGSSSLAPGEMRANIHIAAVTVDGQPGALVGPMGSGGRIGRAAHNVEYGHRIVTGGRSTLGADGRLRGGGTVHATDVPPHPAFRPAFEESRGDALAVLAETIAEDLQQGA